MTGLAVRPPEAADIPAIVELANLRSRAHFATDDLSEADLRSWFAFGGFDPARDAWLALTGEQLVGWAYLFDVGGEHTRFELDVCERPGSAHPVCPMLLDAAERRAAELSCEAPPAEEPLLRVEPSETDEQLKALLEGAGYRLIRHSFRMLTELDAKSEGGPVQLGGVDVQHYAWPLGISIRSFEPDRDERTVYDVQNEGFADTWDYLPLSFEEWRHLMVGSEDFDPSLWFLAVAGEEPVGIVLCRPRHPGDSRLGWIRVLAVRPAWRRRGIARALLLQALAAFRQRGLTRVGLGVDGESTSGALELYVSAGMRVERRYDVYEKPVRRA